MTRTIAGAFSPNSTEEKAGTVWPGPSFTGNEVNCDSGIVRAKKINWGL
jgi:hypothetical protein